MTVRSLRGWLTWHLALVLTFTLDDLNRFNNGSWITSPSIRTIFVNGCYTDVLSTHFPWLYPLTIGVYAATSEEFLFRLFAIPFLMRLTRSRVLAVVLPAFFWGFLHSTYPQQPGYIRGIEVGLIGIVAGVVMLRYGILATLVWHYTVDAALISLFLLR